MLNIEIIQDEARWAEMAEEWNQLLGNSITDVPFLRHEFLTAWWQHRGGGEWEVESSLNILTARGQDGELVGAFPLFESKNRAGNLALFLMGSHEIADFLDVLCKPEQLDSFLDAAVAHLKSEQDANWDTVELFNLLEDSPTLAALQAAAEAQGFTYEQERLQPSPCVPLPDDFDDYLEGLDGRYRRELVRKMRNAMGYFIPVTVKQVGEEDDLHAEVEDFFTMMREEPDKDAFLTEPMAEQMQALMAAAAKGGWLDMRWLVVGRDKAAGYVNFQYGDGVMVYNSSRADKFSNLSPGIVLLGLLVQEAIEEGKTAFDFMRGDEEYKYQLGGQNRFVVKATIKF
ncbi:MAG TPA: GNAT family N-acetyltransferase [Anaerolineales bacterium]|nr:GNAT family N-acetyltransferase [Anaerolineales bacterium]